MKNIKIVVVMILLSAGMLMTSVEAKAQNMVNGTYEYCADHVWHFGSCNGGFAPGYIQNIPIPNGLSSCDSIGALAGGTIGSLAKNNTVQAVILGAILGGVIADKTICNNNGRVVMFTQEQHQTTQNQNQQETRKKHCDKEKGESFAKLNWPGHHQHDEKVCMTDNDPHRGESLPD